MTKDNHTSSLRSQNLPKAIQRQLRATKKSIRNYEVIACINVGKKIATALAVIEDGHATYAVGELFPGQLLPHFSKIDLAIGTHLREYEQLRTETMLEQMRQSGIETTGTSVRYYQKELELRIPTKIESVSEAMREYLQKAGFTVAKANDVLNVRHLERMRHRSGYIVQKEE